MLGFDKKKKPDHDFFYWLDFGMELHKEKKISNGEDSFFFEFDSDKGIVGVFDGCGGSGSRKYERFKHKTGAYMASRIVSGAVRDWFRELPDQGNSSADDLELLKSKIKSYLKLSKEIGGGTSSIKGSLSKEFPTTASMIIVSKDALGQALCLWAGDSRCYLLDAQGLKQLTEDDLHGLDAMENLSADGVLTNVISASKEFVLHQKMISFGQPSILFAATDGCFGYFKTPMEFEYLLLSTLKEADNVEEWEQSIFEVLRKISGDDYSLCGMSIGFGDFQRLKQALLPRCRQVYDTYIADLESRTYEEKLDLWKEYKRDYSVYLEDRKVESRQNIPETEEVQQTGYKELGIPSELD